ncbi:hypothetical protein ACFPM0_11675 [Pseudonocardia sulfidoxydans]
MSAAGQPDADRPRMSCPPSRPSVGAAAVAMRTSSGHGRIAPHVRAQ